MSKYVKNEVLTVARDLNISFEELNVEQVHQCYEALIKHGFIGSTEQFPLWEHLIERESICDPNAWEWLGQFVGDNKVLLILEPRDSETVLLLSNGADLVELLGNSFHFVFYVCDTSFSYLLAFNDHDYLIGCGTSIKWIRSLKEGKPKL